MTNADVPDRNVRDTISRQAVIDALCKVGCGSEGSWIDQKDAFKALNSLPSAEKVEGNRMNISTLQ